MTNSDKRVNAPQTFDMGGVWAALGEVPLTVFANHPGIARAWAGSLTVARANARNAALEEAASKLEELVEIRVTAALTHEVIEPQDRETERLAWGHREAGVALGLAASAIRNIKDKT